MPDDWKRCLRDDGYVLFPGMAPDALVEAARDRIDRDLRDNFDPARQTEYDHISACPDIRGALEIEQLLTKTPIRDRLDEALSWTRIDHDRGQIAIRWAQNRERAVPPDPHIDGIASGHNGVTVPEISNFTALVGVFLSDVSTEFAGNFTVWPGSHKHLERYFRTEGRKAMTAGMPTVATGEPRQLICAKGDIVLCHYQLLHTAAVNTSSLDRIAVYFRIWLKDIGQRRWELLTNIWNGWRLEDRTR